MFEPKTYQEKLGLLNRQLVDQLLGIMPPQVHEQLKPFTDNLSRAEAMYRMQQVNDVAGEIQIPEEERADYRFMLDLLASNLGRTAWDGKLTGALHDGAIGTKGFGLKWREWLGQLPGLYETIEEQQESIASGFYADRSGMIGRHDLPRLYLLINANDQLILIAPFQGRLAAHQLYLKHLPTFMLEKLVPWQQFPVQDEMAPYRGDLHIEQAAVALANALVNQGVNHFAIPLNGAEHVRNALATSGHDKTMQIHEQTVENNGSIAKSGEEQVAFVEAMTKENNDAVKAEMEAQEAAASADVADPYAASYAGEVPVSGDEPDYVVDVVFEDDSKIGLAKQDAVLLEIDNGEATPANHDTTAGQILRLLGEADQAAEAAGRPAGNDENDVRTKGWLHINGERKRIKEVQNTIPEVEAALAEAEEVAEGPYSEVDTDSGVVDSEGSYEELVETDEIARFETAAGVKVYSPNDLIVLFVDGVPHNVTARAAASIWAAAPEGAKVTLALEGDQSADVSWAGLFLPSDAA